MKKLRLSRSRLRIPVTQAVIALEFLLASVVVIGTAWYVFLGLEQLYIDSYSAVFYTELITILLNAIIGVEIARVLVTHSLVGIVDILGFVMARKVLDPAVAATDVLIVVVAFGVLVYVRQWLQGNEFNKADLGAVVDTRPTN